jgi:ABC-type branched-subunit amino acid transport system substrate-binding protein
MRRATAVVFPDPMLYVNPTRNLQSAAVMLTRIRPLLICALATIFLNACAGGGVPPPKPEAKAPAATAKPAAQGPQNVPLITASAPRRGVDPEGPVRVALLLPLSGTAAPTGQGILNAAQLALFEMADQRLILQSYDTQGTPEGAASAATKAISQGAQLILGPVFAGEVKAVSPQAQAAGVNVVAFSTDPSVAGNNVYVLSFLVEAQVREMVAYARSKNLTRFAVLAPDTAYGQSVADTVRAVAPADGAEVKQVVYFDPSGNNLEDVVRRLADFDTRKAALQQEKNKLSAQTDEASQLALKRLEQFETMGEVDFDAIFLPEQGARLTQAATLLPFFDIDTSRVQLLGTMLWSSRGLGREPALVGGLYPAPAPETSRDFANRYRAAFGSNPGPLANHGYDAVALAAVLARSGSADPFRATALTDPAGFSGVDGIFRFRVNGLSERSFAIMQITRDGAEVVRAAPTTFENVGF